MEEKPVLGLLTATTEQYTQCQGNWEKNTKGTVRGRQIPDTETAEEPKSGL